MRVLDKSATDPAPDDTEARVLPAGLPPIQADPPIHTWTRRIILHCSPLCAEPLRVKMELVVL